MTGMSKAGQRSVRRHGRPPAIVRVPRAASSDFGATNALAIERVTKGIKIVHPLSTRPILHRTSGQGGPGGHRGGIQGGLRAKVPRHGRSTQTAPLPCHTIAA